MNAASIKSMYNYFIHSWRRRGVIYSLKIVLAELWFDIKYGTETIELKSLDKMHDVSAEDKADAVHYQASYVYNYEKFFEKLSNKIDFNSAFIDLGSGKGRAMILAAIAGFKKIYGVEFSPELNSISKQNLSNFSKKFHADVDFDVIEVNAKKYQFETDVKLVYMANPFGPDIIFKVLENIDKSLEKKSREILIVYFNPLQEKIITSFGWQTVAEYSDPSGQILFKAFLKQK